MIRIDRMSNILSSQLTKDEINKFQVLYEKYLGISLTDEEAANEAVDFLTVISTLLLEGDFLDRLGDGMV